MTVIHTVSLCQAGEKRWKLVQRTYASITYLDTAILSSQSEGGLTLGIKALPQEKPLINLNRLTRNTDKKTTEKITKNAVGN